MGEFCWEKLVRKRLLDYTVGNVNHGSKLGYTALSSSGVNSPMKE